MYPRCVAAAAGRGYVSAWAVDIKCNIYVCVLVYACMYFCVAPPPPKQTKPEPYHTGTVTAARAAAPIWERLHLEQNDRAARQAQRARQAEARAAAAAPFMPVLLRTWAAWLVGGRVGGWWYL